MTASAGAAPPRVALRAVTVRYGATTALRGVTLEAQAGEVLALVGENGAGKSSAMNVLMGLVRPAAGHVEVGGRAAAIRGPRDARAAGLGMVHQHFALQPSMTVLENVALDEEPGRLGIVDLARVRARLLAVAASEGLALDPDAVVGRLPMGQRQVAEIARLLLRDARTLILDEPTAVLTPAEAQGLFAALRRFRDRGRAVILITHKLDEVMAVADRVAVLRAGQVVAEGAAAALGREAIARAIVGGGLPPPLRRDPPPPGSPALAVEGLRAREGVRDVGPFDLEVRAGEVVGVAGVSGEGQGALVAAVTGLARPLAGRVRIAGRDAGGLPVAERRALGMAYIPEDRGGTGLALPASLAENAAVGGLGRPPFARGPFLRRRAMAEAARALIARHDVRAPGPSAPAAALSGGNRQKLVVARELALARTLVVAENPTWGVDLGAVAAIHAEILARADAGLGVLLVSSELDEVLALSDRVHVMFAGRLSPAIPRAEATRERVGALMVARAA